MNEPYIIFNLHKKKKGPGVSILNPIAWYGIVIAIIGVRI